MDVKINDMCTVNLTTSAQAVQVRQDATECKPGSFWMRPGHLRSQKGSESSPAWADAHDHGGVAIAGVNARENYSPL